EVTARTSARRSGVLLSTAMTRPRIAAVASNGCWRVSRDWGQATGASGDSPRSATTTLLTARELDIIPSVACSPAGSSWKRNTIVFTEIGGATAHLLASIRRNP